MGESSSPHPPCPCSLTTFVSTGFSLPPPCSLYHEKRQTAPSLQYQYHAFRPLVLDIAGVGSKGILGAGGGGSSVHSLLACFLTLLPSSPRCTLGPPGRSSFCAVANEPNVPAFGVQVNQPRALLFRVVCPCLDTYCGCQPSFFTNSPAFRLVTDQVLLLVRILGSVTALLLRHHILRVT